VLKTERIKHWLSVGAQPTERTQRLLATVGVMGAPKVHEQTKQDKPRAKAQERMKAAEEAAKAAAEAAESAAS
jgi:small subunit ribosomal protein S16